MLKTLKYSALLIVLALSGAASAKLAGAGEVSGVVYESWRQSAERVVFRVNIERQQPDSGPALDTPNVFAYNGADRMRITEGDRVKLRYNSDDADGIIVERLEFTDDQPGTVGQLKTLSIAISLSGLLFGIVLIVGAIIYQKKRARRRDSRGKSLTHKDARRIRRASLPNPENANCYASCVSR